MKESEEEARDLVESFKPHSNRGEYDLDVVEHENAKQSAIIAVELVIESTNEYTQGQLTWSSDHWKEVKQAIEKL